MMEEENNKIGILTFLRAYNYGAVLQAYALQKTMKKTGIDCELVDYYPNYFRRMYNLSDTRDSYVSKAGMTACRLSLGKSLRRRNTGFEVFIDREIDKSTTTYRNIELLNPDGYKGFITGSDQVWNLSITHGDTTFLLDGKAFEGKQRFSYAASFGKDLIAEEYRLQFINAIKEYDLISVRESSGANIVTRLTDKEAVLSCDPTLLLEPEEWYGLCGETPLIKDDYIFLYYARSPEYVRQLAKRLSKELHLPVVCVSCTFNNSFVYIYKYFGGYRDKKDGFVSYNEASPYEFLNLIKNAKYVVTSSFHGTVFSILFHKPFLAQTLWKDGQKNIRVSELMNRTGLLSRSANQPDSDITALINWDEVDQSIAAIRQKGRHYIELVNKKMGSTSISDKEMKECDLGPLPNKEKSDPVVYAVKHKDETVRAASRSGGIFTAISDYVLDQGGIIYGCRLTEAFLAEHIRAETREERDTMRGSKYIQSSLGDTYLQIKEDLKNGKQVLFSGTSCQVAGLRGFLRRDYPNLICMDIVCHGVPSKVVWQKYLQWQEERIGKKIYAVDFRNKKDFGWTAHKETLYFDDASHVNSEIFKNLFYAHNILRPSCYECHYKTIHLPGDITIGDYWGIDKAVQGFSDDKGVSLVLINSEKGEQLFEKIRAVLHIEKTDITKAMQPPLFSAFERPIKRDQFWRDFFVEDFDHIVRQYGKKKQAGFFKTAKRVYWKIKRLRGC